MDFDEPTPDVNGEMQGERTRVKVRMPVLEYPCRMRRMTSSRESKTPAWRAECLGLNPNSHKQALVMRFWQGTCLFDASAKCW